MTHRVAHCAAATQPRRRRAPRPHDAAPPAQDRALLPAAQCHPAPTLQSHQLERALHARSAAVCTRGMDMDGQRQLWLQQLLLRLLAPSTSSAPVGSPFVRTSSVWPDDHAPEIHQRLPADEPPRPRRPLWPASVCRAGSTAIVNTECRSVALSHSCMRHSHNHRYEAIRLVRHIA